ncbi:MAG TPA: HprK-related kinase B [Nannocystis exedens]|nr:HprK-related kinase B [Nannocystis exedens]
MRTGSPTPCRDLQGRLLAAAGPQSRLDLVLSRCRVRIFTDDDSLLAALQNYFREFIDQPATTRDKTEPADLEILALSGETPALPGALTIKEDDKGRPAREAWIDLADGRIVHKIRTGVVLVMGEGVELITGPLLGHVDQVVNFVNHRLMCRLIRDGGVLAHAAGIARDDRGLVLCGNSGAGKSTLALHMMAADPSLAFVSNDRAVLDRQAAAGTTILGIPKQPRVNPGTVLHNPALAPLIDERERQRYTAMPSAELRFLEEKRDAVIERLFGPGRFRLEVTAIALIVLRWTPEGGSMQIREVTLEGRRDLQAILHKRLGLFFWPLPTPSDDAGLAALARVLRGVPTYEVHGGIDFEAASNWTRRLLAEAPAPPIRQ